jgi:pyruvate carboxylase
MPRGDKLSLYRFNADEAYQIGRGKSPLEAYLLINEILRVAKRADDGAKLSLIAVHDETRRRIRDYQAQF